MIELGNIPGFRVKEFRDATRKSRPPKPPKEPDPDFEPPRKGFNLTDLGNAERLVAKFGKDLRYCHPWKRWLVWDGRRWATDKTAAARRKARKTVRSIYGEAKNTTTLRSEKR